MKLVDPLAQSFYVEPESGIFVTSVDLYFFSRDNELPFTVQLRPMKLGFPTEEVYPFSEVVVDSKFVSISDDGSVSTRVTFNAPVYLEGKKFHSICLMSNSADYLVWTSRLGEIDVQSINSQNEVVVSKQPLSGSLFKSQNGITWIPSDLDDLKFTLYRGSFGKNTNFIGNINFYNPNLSLGNAEIATLVENSFEIKSKNIKVGIGTTLDTSKLPAFGNTIIQQTTNASGNFVGYAGSAYSNLGIVNSGIGYTPSSGSYTFNGVSLTSITGQGANATANITISSGVAIAATISNGGTGYVIGDLLTASQVGITSLGRNLQLSVSSISGTNQLIIDQVQGEFSTGVGKTIQYINSSGITTDLGGTGSGILVLNTPEVISDGLHIKVNHKNHGMHATNNVVTISNALSDIKTIKLSSNYAANSSDNILVDNTINFQSFENVGISSTNPGYVIIGNEILSYEGTTATSLTGITRQIDQTKVFSYDAGTPIYKYELNGVCLRRINKNHILSDVTVDEPIGLDFYNLKIDMSSADKGSILPQGQVDRSVGISFPKLHFNLSKSTGGSQINATQNIQYELITPSIQTMILNGTHITSEIRTISGSSVNGTELSFSDKGFEKIDLNATNYLDSPRLISSKVNETGKLSTLPANKSFTINLALSTTNSYITPVIDLDRVSAILTTNRVNNVIEDYITDDRVATLRDDPSAFVYATQPINLENPATSIKILLSAYINKFSDVRVLYAIMKDSNEEPIYYPFPGYNNISTSNQIINPSNNDGTADKKVAKNDTLGFKSNEISFKDYEFTVDNLASFRYFSIKIIGSSTNQAYPPRIKDLRVIALA